MYLNQHCNLVSLNMTFVLIYTNIIILILVWTKILEFNNYQKNAKQFQFYVIVLASIGTIFEIPLNLTSSGMCILNSFDDGNGFMKIPNAVVNEVSVLLSYNNQLKVFEKVQNFQNR